MSECASACPKTCQDPFPLCTLPCVAKCECPGDTVLQEMCRSPDTCVCQGGQVMTDCGSKCTKTCDNPDSACTEQCIKRCQCPEGKPILHNGQCIERDRCPKDACPRGQVFMTCGSACTKTCGDPNPRCTKQCVEKCQCPANKPIWHDGQCIKEKQCPKCPGGQVFMDCGSGCTKTCENTNPICTEQCVARCQCPDDKPLWHNNQCVGKESCPVPQCSGGQVFMTCGSACTKTCKNTNPICTEQCVARCQCPDDKPLWHNNQCVGKESCPVSQCSGGQVFMTCGSACTKTCKNTNPICTEQCVARCQCPDDKPLWHNNQCVGKESCPVPQCSGGQVFMTCGSACTKTCKNTNPICTEQCVARCQCPDDKPLWHNNQCVGKESCPVPQCSGGQVFMTCGSACTKTCKNTNPICTEQCVARCQCPDDKPLWHNNQCVGKESCPVPQCSGGQVFMTCGSACTKTCKSTNPICTEQCVARCQCPDDKPLWHNNQCVGKESCLTQQCSGGQVFKDCGSTCTKTCDDPIPVCNKKCVARCECPADRPIWYDNECIEADKCPSENCKGGQVWTTCGNICVKTCEAPNIQCKSRCIPKCECPKERPILRRGKCIPLKKCYKCRRGQEWSQCGSACTRTCLNPFPFCTRQCVPKCECPRDKPLWENKRCVAQKDCRP